MADYLRESGVKWLWERIKTLLSTKQDKLVSGTNIKTINGTSLLGNGDVSISGDASGSVDEGRLVWSSEDSPSTLMDIAYLNGNGNKIAGIPPSLVTIEYSADNGATWVDSGISDANKTRLTNHRINGNTNLRPNGSTTLDINYQTRITIDLIEDNATNAWVGCFEFRKIILKCSGIQRNDTHTLTIEMQKYGSTTWDIIKTSRFWGSPGFFSIPTPKRTVGYPSSSYYRKVRLTWQPGDVYTNVAGINGVYFMSDNTVGVGGGKVPSQYAITGTPYSIDYDQNTIFPNAIKGKKLITDGGKSNQVVLGNGSLRPISELSPITDADADILLDNHIHSINVNANGNNVNINVIESSKNGDTWETEDNDIPIPLATPTSAGVMSKEDKAKLDGLGSNIGVVGVPETLNCNTTYVVELEADDTLSITGFVAPTTLFGNYTVHLKTSTNNSISMPNTLLWANGEQPVFEDNTCYELSIAATLFDAEYVYKAVLVAFK